jgi:hypothetical protein
LLEFHFLLQPVNIPVNLATEFESSTTNLLKFETITTKVPLKIRQITLFPYPDFMSGQSNIDYDASHDCLNDNVSIDIKNIVVEPPKSVHEGHRYPEFQC